MTDTLPTVWSADPHTLIKHAILREYLNRWFPILTRQARKVGTNREILFVDGFAGPGEYQGGEPGSPVIAMQAAIQHQVQFPVPVRMLFIELDKKRFENLQSVITPYREQVKASPNIRAVEPRQGDCDSVLVELLDDFARRDITFGPALAFLDQFGYGEVSMDLIHRIMSIPQCEVFTYLSYKEMHRWMSDPDKAIAMTLAFGGEEWRACVNLEDRKARESLLALYKEALRTRGGSKYAISFLMFDKHSRPLYWLIFCTNSLHGLREMKKAMWRVDESGEFRFSDRDAPDQLKLMSQAFDKEWLAGELAKQLGGRTMTVAEVEGHILEHTPCYLYKAALKRLEKTDRLKPVDPPATRRRGHFPHDQMKVAFVARGLF